MIGLYDSEKILELVVDPVHSRIEDMKKYEKISKKNEELKYFLFGTYINTAKWYYYNKKFDLEEKIVSIGEDFIGVILSLDEIIEGNFPMNNREEIQAISDMIYSDGEDPPEFIYDLKANAQRIYEVLIGGVNRPKMYF